MPLRRTKIVCKPRRQVLRNIGPHGGYWISELTINSRGLPVRNCFRENEIQEYNLTHLLAESNGIPEAPPILGSGVMAGGGLALVSLNQLQ